MTPETKKVGHIRAGWQAAKSAWTVFKLDKELSIFTLVSFSMSLVIMIAAFVAVFSMNTNHDYLYSDEAQGGPNNSQIVVFGAAGLAVGLIEVYTTAAVVAAALIRYRGGDPTLRDGLSAVKRRFGSLTLYGIFFITIGQIIRIIQERIPFIGGRIVAFLAGLLWSAANFFSIPVIVESDKPVSPIGALKGSVNTIKTAWAESAVGSLSIGIIFFFIVLLELTVGIIGTAALDAASVAPLTVAAMMLTGIVVLTTVIIASTLSGIIKAALYYYATTGEVPEHFNRELMHQAFTKKKARRLFS